MILKMLILMFHKINMSEVECCVDGIDMIFKLATLDEFDDVNNLNESIWVWLISQVFSGIAVLDVGPM